MLDVLSSGVIYTASDIDAIIYRDCRLNGLDALAAPGVLIEDTDHAVNSEVWPMSFDDLVSNRLLYTVYLEVFKCIINDRVEHHYEVNQAIKKFVLNKGLIGLIKEMSEYFDVFERKHTVSPHSLWAPLLSEILSTDYSDMRSEQVAGEIFLFGKRLAPFGNHSLAKACEQEFWEHEAYNRQKDEEDLPNYWVELIHQDSDHWFKFWESEDLLPPTARGSEGNFIYTDAYEARHRHLHISPNSIQATCKCKTCKTIALYSYLGLKVPILSEQQEAELVEALEKPRLQTLFRAWKRTHMYDSRVEMQLALERIGSQFCVGAVVPKNWKSYRMVAPDHPLYYHLQTQVERKLRTVISRVPLTPRDHLEEMNCNVTIHRHRGKDWQHNIGKSYKTRTVHHKFYPWSMMEPWKENDPVTRKSCIPLQEVCPIDDQSSQRCKAQTGSVDGSIDTLDLTAASDLHRKLLVAELYPWRVAQDALRSVPYCIIINGKAENLSMFAPMGSPLTFRLMQVTLIRILYTVTLAVARWNAWSIERTMLALARMGVFGDDIVCDSAVTETLLHVLDLFGFKVNIKKSCTDQAEPRFREACGGDYLGGVCVSPQYWPRKRLDMRRENLQTYSIDGWTGEVVNPVTSLISLSKNIAYFSPSANSYLNEVCRELEPKLTTSPIGSSLPDLWSRFPWMKSKQRSKYSYIWWTKAECLTDRGWRFSFQRSDCKEKGVSEDNGWTRELCNWSEQEFLDTIHGSIGWDEESRTLTDFRDGSIRVVTEDEIIQSFAGEDLTSVPKVIYEPKDLDDHARRCGVARYFAAHNIDYSFVVEYVFRQQFYEDGPSYPDEFHKLLGVSEPRDPDSIFGDPKLTWHKAVR